MASGHMNKRPDTWLHMTHSRTRGRVACSLGQLTSAASRCSVRDNRHGELKAGAARQAANRIAPRQNARASSTYQIPPRGVRPTMRSGAIIQGIIVAIASQHVEGAEPHLVVMAARLQRIEIGDAIDAQQHGFAIVLVRRLFSFLQSSFAVNCFTGSQGLRRPH